jgi:hypothetical protein
VRIRIYSKQAKDLTPFEEKACAKMVSTGAIYNVYVECCNPEKSIKNRVFIAKCGSKCVGWSIIQKTNKNYQFMVYVKKLYRRKKIGTRLYTKSKRFFGLKDSDIKVYDTDNINLKFFKSVRNL